MIYFVYLSEKEIINVVFLLYNLAELFSFALNQQESVDDEGEVRIVTVVCTMNDVKIVNIYVLI